MQGSNKIQKTRKPIGYYSLSTEDKWELNKGIISFLREGDATFEVLEKAIKQSWKEDAPSSRTLFRVLQEMDEERMISVVFKADLPEGKQKSFEDIENLTITLAAKPLS